MTPDELKDLEQRAVAQPALMQPYYAGPMVAIHEGDALAVLSTLPDESVQCCVTSPPYWGLRDYGVSGQLGLEATPDEYVARMVAVFREVRRVLRDDGTLWLNMGDSYTGSGKGGNPDAGKQATNYGSQTVGTLYGKTGETARQAAVTNVSRRLCAQMGAAPKNLVGIPWRVAFALQADGWYLRSDIIWAKPNPMPESVTDRPTKAHEYLFLLAKSEQYHYDAAAIAEPAIHAGRLIVYDGDQKNVASARDPKMRTRIASNRVVGGTRNRRTVWTIATQPYAGAHFATFPPRLVEPCILAGCPEGGTVLDPFVGSGTTLAVARTLGRKAIGIELNPAYCELAARRMDQGVLDFGRIG
jgi:DNA modification methylase